MTSIAVSAPLEPALISYTIKMNSSKFGNATLGKVETNLSTTENGYLIESVTKAQGMAAIIIGSNLQEACEFDIIDGQAVSKRYSGGRIGKTDYSVAYDWEQRKVKFDSGDSLDMPKGYLVDNCMFWFAAALLKGEGFSEQSTYVVDGKSKRIRGFVLRTKSDETIETLVGSKEVVKVVLERELRPGRTLTFWLSPDDQYLPLRIEESRKSRTITFEVERLERES